MPIPVYGNTFIAVNKVKPEMLTETFIADYKREGER